MRSFARRFTIALCSLALAFTLAQPAVAHAQNQPLVYGITGAMSFSQHVQFASALHAQGLNYKFTGYKLAQTQNDLTGFPVVAGSLSQGTGFGEILCGGALQYNLGSLTLDLRNLQFENSANGPFITAAIYLNNILQGRQTVFISYYDLLWGLQQGSVVTQKNYISFDPSFQSLFINFFQVPQLSDALNAPSIGFVTFSLDAEPQ